jgi:hypothetical protein
MKHLWSCGVPAVIAVVVAVSSVRVGLVEARGARQSSTSQRGKTAGEAFKNIQVFTDLPESQLNDTMFFMKGSLGVSCTHCHVDFEHFEKDDKPAKHVARDMIRMVRALNDSNFGGRTVITCNTCHRGQVRPSAPLSFAPIVGPRPAAAPADHVPSLALPTVDQIFDRYVDATGGSVAQAQVATLVMKGSMSSSEGWTAPLELDQKAPAKSLSTFELQGQWRSGFNGTAGWGQDNQDVHTLAGADLALFRLQSSFFRPTSVKGLYSGLALGGTDTVAGRAAYVVEGTLTGAGLQRLFFDTQSGLLVRVTAWTATAFGPLPEEFDLENYRSVGNVKVPFTVSVLKPDFSEVDRLKAGQANVPIDDARFERPAGKK